MKVRGFVVTTLVIGCMFCFGCANQATDKESEAASSNEAIEETVTFTVVDDAGNIKEVTGQITTSENGETKVIVQNDNGEESVYKAELTEENGKIEVVNPTIVADDMIPDVTKDHREEQEGNNISPAPAESTQKAPETVPVQTTPAETQTTPTETQSPTKEPEVIWQPMPDFNPEDWTNPPTPEEQGYDIHSEEYAKEVEYWTFYYINQFRVEEGKKPLISNDRLNEYSKIRSRQLLDNWAHDPEDMKDAAEQAGLEWPGAEAIGDCCAGGSPQEDGKNMATGLRNSPGHWGYIGDATAGGIFPYGGVGVTVGSSDCSLMLCVSVSDTNP